jgi:uncharacterized protein (TIGR02246 family)
MRRRPAARSVAAEWEEIVSTSASPSKTASEILAEAGIEEDLAYYGPFTGGQERAVLTVPMRIQSAWVRNDANAFADVFTTNGSLLMQDEQLTSREAIRAYMRAGFRGLLKGARVRGWPLSVHSVSDGVVVVITQGGIIFPGEEDIAPEHLIRAAWVIVSRDGGWKLLSHQSSPVKG